MGTVELPSYAEERQRLIDLVPAEMRKFLEEEFRFEFKGPVVLTEALKERQRRKNLYDGEKEAPEVDEPTGAQIPGAGEEDD